MKMGDKFTMNVPVLRKWWQVWKPNSVVKQQMFNTVCTSDDFIEASIRAENIHLEERLLKWYVDDLTRKIAQARRNKKKSSHLVAELKKFEEQK